VRAVLDRHPGAEYGVMSEPGHGSDFWFSLPREATDSNVSKA
jgi:signal transduction histidine kinase